jgi:hypothetical protein
MPAKEPKIDDFKYVDVWYSDDKGKSSPWQRIEVGNLPKFQQEEAFNFNCFATVQRFANKSREKEEAFVAPLFFDLDYKEDPAVAQAEAVKIVDFFTKELDVKPTDIWVYFSGSKGFHILVSSQAIGIQPRNDLHKVFKHIAGYLKYRLGETTTKEDEVGKKVEVIEPLKSIDLVVYTNSRMLRLPNSVHQHTRLFKIELTLEELKTLSLDDIKDKARMPRRSDDGLLGSAARKAVMGIRKETQALYLDKLEEYGQAAATANKRYEKEEFLFVKGKPPVCVEDILSGGWKKEGDRNQATVQLACYFKAAGHPQAETLETLEEWVKKHTSAKSGYQVQQRVANTRSVVEAVYSKENEYKFGCAFIRSLHGEKTPGSKGYDRVPCAGDLCPVLKRNAEPDEEAESLHLAATGDAELTGKLVKTKVMIAGKKHTPYIVPKKIEYSCWGRDKCKKYSCPLYNIPTGTAFKDLGPTSRELIQMTGTGDDNIKGILRELSGVPSCGKYDTEIVETTNIDELLVIPMAEVGAENQEEETHEGGYVLRRVYSVGGLPISENKYYEISGYVFPHPKNQESTILIKHAEPLQDVVERFELTDEVKEDLAVFQPADYTPEAIAEKMGAILNDLTYNVTHIVERDEVLLGALLVYHSVLRFNVPWDMEAIRGWTELKIVGDTGTGKSHLLEKLMTFTGLGTRVNAESTSRTGLTYKMEQSGSGGAWYIVWGAWPLADRELIWIDEDTGIKKDEYGEMTLARSDGKLEVKRAVTAETPCRVRAIMSGNVPKGKRLADYAQGVESLKDVFNNEDIRRFDFGVFMRATDVDASLYNQQLPTYPNMVNGETLKNNILFAWSRGPEDVIFTGDAIDRVLEAATDLSKVYGNATDVPLVSPSDQRNKIARLSVALAALTRSVDETGSRLLVWPGHVDFIFTYLKGLYNAPGCGLNYYARLSVKEEELNEEKFEILTKELRKLDTLKGDNKYLEFITLFAQQKYLRLGDVEAMLSIEKDEAKAIVNQCARLRMLVMTSGGYRKTPRFNAYIAKCFEMGLFDYMDNDII